MELRLIEIALTSVPEPRVRRSHSEGHRPVVAITFASEIEGEAPLIAFAEAVDDY